MKRIEWERLEYAHGHVLCVGAALCAVPYSFHLLSFLHAKEAVLYFALAMASTMALPRGRMQWQGIWAFGPVWLFLLCVLVFHLLAGGAAVRTYAAESLARGALLLLAGALAFDLLRDACWRYRFTNAFLISAVLVSLLFLLQRAGLASPLFPDRPSLAPGMYSVFGNADLLGGYAAMALPLFVHRFLRGQRLSVIAAAGVLLMAAAVALSECRSAWIAASVGLGAAALPRPISMRRAGLLFLLLAGVITGLVALQPARFMERVKGAATLESTGVRARLWMWDGTLRMIAAHPAAGVGLGNYLYWSPLYMGEALHDADGANPYWTDRHVQHAHSDPLELAAEAGVLGVLCACWMLARLARRRGPEWLVLLVLLIFSLANFPFHSAPHALAGVLFAGMLLARDAPVRTESRKAAVVIPGATITLAVFMAWAGIWPSFLLRSADIEFLDGRLALPSYIRAMDHLWPSALARHNYAIALARAKQYDEAEAQARIALHGLDTGPLYLLIGALAQARGANEEARECLEASVFRTPGMAEAWVRLARVSPPDSWEALRERARPWLSLQDYAKLDEFHTEQASNVQ